MKRILLLALSFMLLACQSGNNTGETGYFIVKGHLENAREINLFLEELTTNDLIPLHTFTTDSAGFFSHRQPANEAGFYVLRVDENENITLVVEPGEEIHIKGDANTLSESYRIEGSPGSVLLSELNRHLRDQHELVDSLAKVFRESQYQDDFMQVREELKESYREIFSAQQEYVKKFIRSNPRSLASIIALYQYFGNRLLLTESEHFEYYELLSQSLARVYPTNKHVLDLSRRVNLHRRNEARRRLASENIAPGKEAPEVILPCPEGEMVALSSLRGNYVLVDFWAAWCAPCREANSKLSDIYEEYRDHGFEIYGISLDRTREQWLQGIKDDEINWIQVSDLRIWNSPVVALYNVEKIPFSVLLDPDGIIIEKNPTPEKLREILSAVFEV